MKIKRQLHIFLLLVVLIPLVAFAMIPINRQLAIEGISFEKIIRISFLVASVIELVCIIFTLHISNTISKSITFLIKKSIDVISYNSRDNFIMLTNQSIIVNNYFEEVIAEDSQQSLLRNSK